MINPFKKTFTPQEMSLFRFLSKVKVFEDLDYKELSYFVPFLHEREYKRDEIVFFRGDPSQAFYIIKKGRVSLSVDIEDKFEMLDELKTNQSFGDNAFLNNTRRIYTSMITSDEAILYVIPRVNIHEIFDREVEVKAKVMQSLSSQYNEYTTNVFKAYQSSFGFFDLGKVYKS
jgi:CRP-like cAMP-binding protein